MIQLPQVTLLIADDINPLLAREVLNICTRDIKFGAVKLLTSHDIDGAIKIMPLRSLAAYSVFMLSRCHEYIDTPNVLIVQRDGFILNPGSFDTAWLELDYIGPLFIQYDKVGSGGFSMRSKKIMECASSHMNFWDGTEEEAQRLQSNLSYYEDGVLCMGKPSRKHKIASLEQAANFAHGGNRNPEYFRSNPFGFHRTWADVDFKTGTIDYSDTTKDLNKSYDKYILGI